MNASYHTHRHTAPSRSSRKLVWVAAVLMLFSVSACSWLPRAPLYIGPTPLPELAAEIVKMPQKICIGQIATFTVKTKLNNECFAFVRYQNKKGSWESKNFEPIVADRQGLCEWTWQVTDDAVVGTAAFGTGVEGHGHVEPLIPQPFDIKDCSK